MPADPLDVTDWSMPLSTLQPLEAAIVQAWPATNWLDSHVLVAVSGGPDSVALLRGVLAVKQCDGGPGRLCVAHVHHGLRGAAADEDQAWLEKLCGRCEIPFEVVRADVVAAAAEQGDGWEAAARQARYEFLCATAERLGARWVALGHTADDQVETVLHRVLRGTGLAGLAGMPRFRALSPSVTLVRPLLDVTRREVLRYLAALGQDYRTDASNAETLWTRNRLRNELLPAIRTHINTDVDGALRRLAVLADEAQQIIAETAAELAEESVEMDGSAPQIVRINRVPLLSQPRLMVCEVFKTAWQHAGWPLQAMGFHQWNQLAELVNRTGYVNGLNLPGDVLARYEAQFLVLERRQTDS
jgi:tRNA(Ile)-lysidine synthase